MENISGFNPLIIYEENFWNQPGLHLEKRNDKFVMISGSENNETKTAPISEILLELILKLGENLNRNNFPILFKNVYLIKSKCDHGRNEPVVKKTKTLSLSLGKTISQLAEKFHYTIKTDSAGKISLYAARYPYRENEGFKSEERNDPILVACHDGMIRISNDPLRIFNVPIVPGMPSSVFPIPFDCTEFDKKIVKFALSTLHRNEEKSIENYSFKDLISIFKFAHLFENIFNFAKLIAKNRLSILISNGTTEDNMNEILKSQLVLFTDSSLKEETINLIAKIYSTINFHHIITSTKKLLDYYQKKVIKQEFFSRIQKNELFCRENEDAYVLLYRKFLSLKNLNRKSDSILLKDHVVFTLIFSKYLETIEFNESWVKSGIEISQLFTRDNFPKLREIVFSGDASEKIAEELENIPKGIQIFQQSKVKNPINPQKNKIIEEAEILKFS